MATFLTLGLIMLKHYTEALQTGYHMPCPMGCPEQPYLSVGWMVQPLGQHLRCYSVDWKISL